MNPSNGPRRTERVVLQVEDQLIAGEVTLPREGYQSRFSDSINRADIAFVPLLDVEVTPVGGGETVYHDFLLVGKRHIRLAYPDRRQRQ